MQKNIKIYFQSVSFFLFSSLVLYSFFLTLSLALVPESKGVLCVFLENNTKGLVYIIDE